MDRCGSGCFRRTADRLCTQARGWSDSARHPRRLRLRIRIADGADEPQARAAPGDGIHAAWRALQLPEFEAGARDRTTWRAAGWARTPGRRAAVACQSPA